MSYEAFREQCAKVAETMPKFLMNGSMPLQDRIAEKIRSQPLPEVSKGPRAYTCHRIGEGDVLCGPDSVGDNGDSAIPLYALPPDTEALRAENERLRESNTELLQALKATVKELHSCQAVIHFAGGFDSAYVIDAQAVLKVARAVIDKVEGGAA